MCRSQLAASGQPKGVRRVKALGTSLANIAAAKTAAWCPAVLVWHCQQLGL
jgi:hypothetical protein